MVETTQQQLMAVVAIAKQSQERRERHRRRTSRDQKPVTVADSQLWHSRLGHPGPKALEQLGIQCLGARLKGPSTVKCDHCAQGKAHRQISRRMPARPKKPFEEIWIDWTDMSDDIEEYSRVMFITDAYSGFVYSYFLQTHGSGQENKTILQDFLIWTQEHHGYKVRYIRSDGELFSKTVRKELRKRGIQPLPSAPNTQSQNGGAERTGGIIMGMARSMKIAANLPHTLWRHIVEAACYLRNRTPVERNDWQSPYERVFSQKPTISHLRAYGCKAFPLTREAQLRLRRRQKLEPKAEIGRLIGYQSTNIFKIWIPYKNKVILTRDVTFNEQETFFNGIEPLTEALESRIREIQIPEDQVQKLLSLEIESDVEDMVESDEEEEVILDEIVVATDDLDHDQESHDTDESGNDISLPPTPPHSDHECLQAVLSAYLPIRQKPGIPGGVEGGQAIYSQNDQDDLIYRFHEYHPVKTDNAVQGAFNAGFRFKRTHRKNLPPLPESQKDLRNHPFKEQFIQAQKDHLTSHDKMESFQQVPWSKAKGYKVLGCMWVFLYKTDRHGFLMKCKARLVVCGNQQQKTDMPTRATTLASMAFRALMAIAAIYDLELEQMDAVNAFVNCTLDEVVYMRSPPGFPERGPVLRLKKALYGLRRSPLLWQKALTKKLQEIGFKVVPQEPCIMKKGAIFVFFYVDDIIWAYPKGDIEAAKAGIKALSRAYEMTYIGNPQWFLGIHILRQRSQRVIWLAQDAYLEKVANRFEIDLSKSPDTPLEMIDLDESKNQATPKSTHEYLGKIGSILFAAISTRPDIAFAASKLARFNTNPSERHHKAVNRVIQYLYHTRSYALRLGNSLAKIPADIFLCSSDASFADNKDRKSSQGYVLRLFGSPIAWRASKQKTVTTSSTEAELLAISEAAKEMIFTSRLLTALQVQIDQPLQIECDNSQTIRLLTEESNKLSTRLKHIDIHQHWLRQEVQNKRIAIHWVESQKMIADGLTKALPKQKHQEFIKQLFLEDIRVRIQADTRLQEALDDFKSKTHTQNQALTLRLSGQGRLSQQAEE